MLVMVPLFLAIVTPFCNAIVWPKYVNLLQTGLTVYGLLCAAVKPPRKTNYQARFGRAEACLRHGSARPTADEQCGLAARLRRAAKPHKLYSRCEPMP
jgi:hypothetical protein